MFSTRILLLIAAAAAGGLVPFQSIVNSRLGSQIGSSPGDKLLTTLVSFTGGTFAALVMVLVLTPGIPKWKLGGISPIYFTGGFYGVIFVTAAVVLTPRVGVAAVTGAILCGQLLSSLPMEHFGLLGTPKSQATPVRVAGMVLMLIGLTMFSQRADASPAAAETELPAEVGE